jgi:hypothetical protein
MSLLYDKGARPAESKTSGVPEPRVIARMQILIDEWEAAADPRRLFLRCYQMMTRNMLASISRGEFADPAWVNRLLHRFAGYYFLAEAKYRGTPEAAPSIWRSAHDATRDPAVLPIQKLLLGVNAHINYDLVLTLVDLLRREWPSLPEPRRALRHADHCRVNAVIAATIGAVQDQIVEPAMPWLDLVDKAMGPLDELLIGRLIAGWRESVWQHAVRLLACASDAERAEVLRDVEARATAIGGRLGARDLRAAILGLLTHASSS